MILLPKAPKIISEKENQAVFEVEALYPGYGITIGNSLRRVLLSSLEGSAVTQMKIKGVQHEFSTIPGIAEDVITIAMNLKQLRFKVHSADPVKISLKVKGEKEVKGSDFKLPSQIELVNKSAHIAALTSKSAELDMEIQVEKGIGYQPVESRKKQEKLEIGTIPIDAIFTPIRRVNYTVENMRVGDRTDFDRLRLDITTDGTITPKKAFCQAVKVLLDHFCLFVNELTSDSDFKKASAVKAEKKGAKKKKEALGKEDKNKSKTAKKDK